MSEWKKVRLGDVVNFNQETYSEKENWDYVNYLDTGNITENYISIIQYMDCNVEMLPSRAKRKVKINDIVFSTVRPIQRHFGFVKELKDHYLVSTGFAVITTKSELADSKYIYYFLTQTDITNSLQVIAEQRVSTYPAINTSDIADVEINLPSLLVQKKISMILSSLDDKIELNNRMNRNLEQQAQAVFRERFIDNAKPEWKEGKLEDIGTIIGGGTPSKEKTDYFTDKGIAWITPKDLSVSKNKFTVKGESDITEIGYKNSSAQKMPRGTVLFSSRAPIGYISIAKNEVCTNQGFKSIIPNKNIGTPFVYYFLKENTTLIENKASGSTFKEASGSLMKSIGCVIPDDNTLTRFNSFCEPLFAEQEKLEEENEKLSTIRDALLPKLMNERYTDRFTKEI
jgi:type I restriction enzyme, S subunit